MKVLIVDSEPGTLKLGIDALRPMPGIDVRGAISAERALMTAAEMSGVDLLITEVVMDPIDGFALRNTLEELYPAMRTAFLTEYDLSEFTEYLNGTEVLAKPATVEQIVALVNRSKGPRSSVEIVKPVSAGPEASSPVKERSQSTSLRNLVQRQGFTGKLDQFQLVDILQMCCLSRRTGRLQISKGTESGVLFLSEGNMTHAVAGPLEGDEAVHKIISWDFGQFSFEEGLQPDRQSINTSWEHVIMEGVRLRDETGTAPKEEEKIDLVGTTLGPYQITKKIGEGEWGEVYEAIQTSVDRKVALKVLWKDLGDNPEAIQNFIALASAKANVSHPNILSVYEAGEDKGRYFYALELVEGVNLRDLQAQGRTIDDQMALHLLQVVAEAMLYLNQSKVPHTELDASCVYLGFDKRARVANLGTPYQTKALTAQDEIKHLSKFVSSTMQSGAAASPGFRAMLTRMLIDGSGGFPSFGALLQAVKALQPKVLPADAYKLTEKDRAAIEAVEKAKKRQKQTLIFSAVGMFALIWAVLFFIYFQFLRPIAARDFNVVVEVPAGEFKFQDDQKLNLPTFYIDQHEVSIAQFAEFLAALESNPTIVYDDPKTPKSREHRPDRWDMYFRSASGKLTRDTFNGSPVDLNMPVMYLDWYAAYAYAKWRGGRLPTEQEWEKAAGGTEGFRYPWGNEMQFKGVNTGSDYAEKGKKDGFQRWAPVDAMKADRSPFGVLGMAGNVSEWTASFDKSTTQRGAIAPVIRGANFGSADHSLTRRMLEVSELFRSEKIGFRVVYDTPPDGARVIKPEK